MRSLCVSLILALVPSLACNSAQMAGAEDKVKGGTTKSKDESGNTSEGGDKTLGTKQADESGAGGENGDGAGNGPGGLGENGDQPNGEGVLEDDSTLGICKDKPLKTAVKLLTPVIQNGVPGNKVAYEMQLLDCQGKPRPMTAQYIHFDLDAEEDDPSPNSFVVQVGTQTVSGSLQVVNGVDLFGKSGPDYFHHKTDQPITLTETALTAILTINLGGTEFFPLDYDTDGPFSAMSYLRFGDAEPVSQLVQFN